MEIIIIMMMMMEGWIYEKKKKGSIWEWIIGWMDINPSLDPVRALLLMSNQ